MIINKYVIHVLDESGIILNDYEGKNNMNIERFIQKQVKKVLKHEFIRKAKFDRYEGNIIRNCSDNIIDAKNMFLSSSKEIASYYYDIMSETGDIQSCDLLIASIEVKDKSYVAILKFDYKKIHNHKVEFIDEKFNIQMIENEIAIQNTSISEAAIIAVNTLETEYDLYVLDIEAERTGTETIFIKEFLDVDLVEDATYLTKEFIALTSMWINNSIPDILDAEGIRDVRNYMLINNSVMDLKRFTEEALDFEQDELFTRFCNKFGLDKDFTIDKNVVDKKLIRRKIKTLTGFEVYARLNDFEDKMKFKIERNANGSYDIIIKNVDYFYEK